MLEGKALIQDTDMPTKMQLQAMSCASQALDLFDVADCKNIAAHIKKNAGIQERENSSSKWRELFPELHKHGIRCESNDYDDLSSSNSFLENHISHYKRSIDQPVSCT